MEEEKNAFYVVRKGDVVGVYKSLSDCQAQAGSSVSDPPVSVFKGYCLTKEAEEFLMSCGLKNASYTVDAADLKNNIFGHLVQCPAQPPASSRASTVNKEYPQQSPQALLKSGLTAAGFTISPSSLRKNFGLQNVIASPAVSSNRLLCMIEFDGASKGNPGQAGAGAVLRAEDGSVVCRLREGVGIATNNVAEYRAAILGLRYALQKGFNHVRVRGDSKLVCMQIQGLWKTKNQNMADLCKVAKELTDQFSSFEISHIARELNSEADSQANLAVHLREGQVEVDHI
ncbi:uncharacterized protein LOC115757496 isoform X1 [Rhodamnia argentea]|uniref:Uncharacterized protein LOC115757496 isoform X1 n=1 Tax=Rhodamnia argentea TaxID=178133 RepID=A0A8B8R289_9MYRT|nr:uncharacterized protein LOC115757496 isoform X1 [Rhodamnia argentea]XP_030553599.1 uncharacterized protein LOC115757496 isoform X1 [Rhodamnia argentea]XP_048128409.1 uncharacterized protein LOC115757496 isoform X1 [Rhodamnia argentea]